MDHENREEFIDVTTKSRKRRRDDQDPPLPPPKDSDQRKKKRHDSDASTSKKPQALTDPEKNKLIQKIRDMRSFIKLYCKKIRKLKLSKADLEDQIDLVNPEGNQVVPDVNKPLPLGGPLDLQLKIESYQIKLNLTQSSWDASDFQFKEDYTIVYKTRAVIYRDMNNQKKMTRETDVHKFIDGTLQRILEKMDHMVKYYVLFKFNLGIKHRILVQG
nr:hypothetical protein [Tanacetum cinerariifolium]